MAWIEPIFDRTRADVDKIKNLYESIRSGLVSPEELAEYQRDLKGAINRSDLQRVVNNLNYLADLLDVSITSQTIPEIPRASWYSTLRSNLSTVLNAYAKHADTPNIPSRPFNTYQKWNTIEKIIWDIKDIYESNLNAYAGTELYANNDILI